MFEIPKIVDKSTDYNTRLEKLQKAISVNSSQIVLAESKLWVRPLPPPSLGSYLETKIPSGYSNRSNSSIKDSKLSGIDMLKNYYKNKRSNA